MEFPDKEEEKEGVGVIEGGMGRRFWKGKDGAEEGGDVRHGGSGKERGGGVE